MCAHGRRAPRPNHSIAHFVFNSRGIVSRGTITVNMATVNTLEYACLFICRKSKCAIVFSPFTADTRNLRCAHSPNYTFHDLFVFFHSLGMRLMLNG